MLDLATALAVGGDCFADIATARERSAVFGKVRAHLEKESAALLANEDSDFTPLLAFVDHGSDGTGGPVAAYLRPDNADHNTADGHLDVTRKALAQLSILITVAHFRTAALGLTRARRCGKLFAGDGFHNGRRLQVSEPRLLEVNCSASQSFSPVGCSWGCRENVGGGPLSSTMDTARATVACSNLSACNWPSLRLDNAFGVTSGLLHVSSAFKRSPTCGLGFNTGYSSNSADTR